MQVSHLRFLPRLSRFRYRNAEDYTIGADNGKTKLLRFSSRLECSDIDAKQIGDEMLANACFFLLKDKWLSDVWRYAVAIFR